MGTEQAGSVSQAVQKDGKKWKEMEITEYGNHRYILCMYIYILHRYIYIHDYLWILEWHREDHRSLHPMMTTPTLHRGARCSLRPSRRRSVLLWRP